MYVAIVHIIYTCLVSIFPHLFIYHLTYNNFSTLRFIGSKKFFVFKNHVSKSQVCDSCL